MPISVYTLCPPAPELYSILMLEWSFQNPGLVTARYTSSTSTTITAVIPSWLPSALRRTRLECTGLGMVWSWLPHPIVPSNRTGLSNHHGSADSLLPKALTHTVPSAWNSLPFLLPHIGSFLLILQERKK